MALSDIDTIIIVMLENRSFDHMLGYLSLPSAPVRMPVVGLQDDPAWRDPRANRFEGKTYPIRRLAPGEQEIADPHHDYAAIKIQIETPPADALLAGMGGFVESYARFSAPQPADLGAVMGYYDAETVPVFDFFARHFAVCDHWFAALPCGTQANRLMAMSGESPILDNSGLFLPDQPLVYDWLAAHDVRWCAYQAGGFFPFFSLMKRWLPEIVTSLSLSEFGGKGRFRRYKRFAADWAAPEPVPSVIFVEPEYTDGPHDDPNDDHSPTGVAKGQAFLADIYSVLISNPGRWANTMMVVTYDEHGGFFDHVPPLQIPAQVAGVHVPTTGARVPAIVISPQVDPGSVFTGPLDHTSILQFFDDKFSPGAGYSAAVNARQVHLNRLQNILQPKGKIPRAPSLPAEVLQGVQAAAATSPTAPAIGASPGDPPNAQALHKAVLKAEAEHSDQIAGPGWEHVRSYLAAQQGAS